MSEVKPVYQAKMTFEGTFCEVSEDDYKRLCGSDTIQTRILYPAAALEALQAENDKLKATISDLTKAYERESNDCLEALEERDYWYNKADALADKISEVFDVPIGEHSNVNCPIVEAMKILCGEYITKFDKENAEQAKRIECLELEIAEQNKRIKWFEKTNEEQAKRIVFLKDVIALNHDWHELYDDYDGYKDSTLCNMNTKALEAQKGTE